MTHTDGGTGHDGESDWRDLVPWPADGGTGTRGDGGAHPRRDGGTDPRPETRDCACQASFAEPTGTGVEGRTELRVDADNCPGDGDLAASPACRATVVGALADRDADVVRVRTGGRERVYAGDAAALLVAAGRFVDLVAVHDVCLAAEARHDPLGAAHEATGRAGAVADLAAETGLAEGAARADGYDDALRAFVGPRLAQSRVAVRPPAGASLAEVRELPTGATVRRYETDEGPRYHLAPAERDLDAGAMATLADAAEHLAAGDAGEGPRAPARAVRAVAGADDPVETLTAVLRKHTLGNGVLDDLFADPRLSDAFVTAPAPENPVRVVVDGESMPTNVVLSARGVATLASRVRRDSGRAFSRASPRVDAALDTAGGAVRVAGVTRPVSDGPAFAVRRHDEQAWDLAALVGNGTLPPDAAALCSLAVERGATGLVAGSRGAGKTTFLGALCRAVPRRTRTVVIEDTPELPVDAMQAAGRDVQALRVGTGDADETTPADALRTALRLGDGALVLGEVRGEEAGVLYEAMRVGAAAGAVLGTIHGSDGAAVRDRVVDDLGVPPGSFAATDLVVTCVAADGHRVARVEEVRATGDGSEVVPLYGDDGGRLEPTGRIDRGDSALVAGLAEPGESYADVRDELVDRGQRFAARAGVDP